MTDAAEKEEIELLGSPIERRLVRIFVIAGPVGLAVAIMLSLWVSQLRLTHSLVVQAEPQWVPGEALALRVQLTPEVAQEPGPTRVELAVEQDGQRHPLASPHPVEPGGMAQGRIEVPSLTPGPALLHVHVETSPFPPRDEVVPLEVVSAREPVPAQHVVSSSMSQHADDSDPQPAMLRLDVRPFGRVTAGFDNELLVRVTDAAGRPWSGPAAVRLLDGELGRQRGKPLDASPPVVWEGRTDAAGLAVLQGALSSDVLRLLVQVRAEGGAAGEPAKVLHERRIQLTSFAGAVSVTAEPVVAAPGGTVKVLAAGLGAKRPVFVDVYGPDGAWIDTFDPPVLGREPAREWTLPAGLAGLVQLEGYHFTNAPGESTAVARLWAADPSVGAAGALRAGIERQRARLSVPRSDRTWDAARERAYLDALERGPLDPAALASAQRWVIGTLPVEVHGPPTLLRTRERDEAALLAYKRAWIMGLRIFVFGGGGLYLISMTVLMLRTQSRDATATLVEMQALTHGRERESLELGVRQARRATMARGMIVVLVMAAGLVIAVLALETLVWAL